MFNFRSFLIKDFTTSFTSVKMSKCSWKLCFSILYRCCLFVHISSKCCLLCTTTLWNVKSFRLPAMYSEYMFFLFVCKYKRDRRKYTDESISTKLLCVCELKCFTQHKIHFTSHYFFMEIGESVISFYFSPFVSCPEYIFIYSILQCLHFAVRLQCSNNICRSHTLIQSMVHNEIAHRFHSRSPFCTKMPKKKTLYMYTLVTLRVVPFTRFIHNLKSHVAI